MAGDSVPTKAELPIAGMGITVAVGLFFVVWLQGTRANAATSKNGIAGRWASPLAQCRAGR